MILYSFLVLAMRAMGKRQLGQFQPYEFVMVMLISNLIAGPMSDVATPLLFGLLPLAALYVTHALIKVLSVKSDRFRAVVSGRPSLIISKGILQQDELKRLALSLSDVMEGLRMVGILDPAEAGTAVLEANGIITAFPRSSARPPKNSEMSLDAGYEGMPMALVMDGRVQTRNLESAMLTREWLNREIAAQNQTLNNIFLMVLDTQGRLTIQDRSGNIHQYQAVPAGEVKW